MAHSEQVKACQDVVRVVVPLLRERGAAAEAKLLEQLAPAAPGGVAPFAPGMFALLASALEAYQSKLEAADEAHARELDDDALPRQERDRASNALYSEMIELRAEVEALFGATGIQALGLSGATPKDAPRLERLARDVAGRLLQPALSLGEPKKQRLLWDRAAAGAAIEELAKALRASLEVVDREVAESRTTQSAREQALETWQSQVPALCGLARSLLLVAGDEDGASRVVSKPTRYRSRPAEESPASPPSVGALAPSDNGV